MLESVLLPFRSHIHASARLSTALNVRRHGFLDRPQLELSEYLAHLFVDVKRPACGIASAVR